MHNVYSRQKWHVDVYLIRVTQSYTGVSQQCPENGTTSLNYFKTRSTIRTRYRPTALPSISVYQKLVTKSHGVNRIGLPWTDNENNSAYRNVAILLKKKLTAEIVVLVNDFNSYPANVVNMVSS